MTNIDKTEIGPVQWIFKQHEDTNHMYDTYLPYSFHLRMVTNAAKDYIHLLPKNLQHSALLAAWGHDLIEDTRVSYNDVKEHLGQEAADIVYAVTNEKGKNRKERGGVKYYEGIRQTPGAVFVKLCDRIANVQYSKMTKSRMFEMYKKEHQDFELMIGRYTQNKDLEPMFEYLSNLFENE
jgi:(p)ppGpp synthase/HD superfamily hydrolase